MDFLKENAKAIAGAVTTLIVLFLKPYVPEVLDPSFQPAVDLLINVVLSIVAGYSVWQVANKPKDS